MEFYNPSGEAYQVRACGQWYKFDPFSSVDVWEQQHIRVLGSMKIGSAYNEHGLVPINYNKQNQEKYATFQEYKIAKALEGLKALKSKKREYWVNEKQALVDVTQYKGGEADKEIIDPDKFQEKIRDVEIWIKMIEDKAHPVYDEFKPKEVSLNDFTAEQQEQLKAQLMKNDKASTGTGRKRGRPARLDNGPVGDTHSSAPEA